MAAACKIITAHAQFMNNSAAQDLGSILGAGDPPSRLVMELGVEEPASVQLRSVTSLSLQPVKDAGKGERGQGQGDETSANNLTVKEKVKQRLRPNPGKARVFGGKARVFGGKARMFGVKCNFGTDDFFFLSLFALTLRGAWLIYGLVVCTYVFLLHAWCEHVQVSVSLQVALLGLLTLSLLLTLCYVITAILSSRGTLIRTRPRDKVVGVVYVWVLLSLLEVGWYVFSMYVVVATGLELGDTGSGNGGMGVAVESGSGMEERGLCSSYKSWVIQFGVLVGLGWILCGLFASVFLFGLDPCGCFLPARLVSRLADSHERHKQDYMDKLLRDYDEYDDTNGHHSNDVGCSLVCSRLKQSCCPCLRRDGLKTSRRDAFYDVVKVLRLLFQDTDATFSDILAGFLLANLHQRRLKAANKNRESELSKATVKLMKENGFVSSEYCTPPPKPLTSMEAEELAEELSYYFKFCAATYGCPIQLYLHPCTGPFSLCLAAKCCCCCNICQLEQFDGDTCYPNPAAIQAITDVGPEEILAASFINSVYKVPYYAVYQQEERRLVIAIRGTLSLEDALTDVSVSMLKIRGGLMGVRDSYVHRGFYESAMYVYQALMNRSRFKECLNTDYVREIVITGHSLGAAVAAVLAVLFKHRHKNEPWIDCLRAITFSTPAAVMNYPLAEKTKDFIISVVGANDLVSRMTIRSLGHLKLVIGTMLASVDASKHRVLCCSGQGWYQCCPPRDKVLEEENILSLAHSESELQSVASLDLEGDHAKLRKYQAFHSVDRRWRRETTRRVVSHIHTQLHLVKGGTKERKDQPMMFLPGRVLHLEELDQYEQNKCCRLRRYRKVRGSWKAREDLSTIIVDADMFLDHTPHRFISLLKRLQRCPDLGVPERNRAGKPEIKITVV